jgi:hypothetical protein
MPRRFKVVYWTLMALIGLAVALAFYVVVQAD